MLCGDAISPTLHAGPLDLDGLAAGPTEEVMVVTGAALAVQRFAGIAADDVDEIGLGQQLQRAIHRGQSDAISATSEKGMDLLGAAELVDLRQRARHDLPLPSRPDDFSHDRRDRPARA